MSDADDDSAADGIEQGKRLIRSGGKTGRSLGERLTDRLQRAALGGRRFGRRHPLKLITVPTDPITGDHARGKALLAGEIRYRGETRAIDALDLHASGASPAFAQYLHGFCWLRDLSTVATRAEGAPIAQDLTARWIGANGERESGPAWRPDSWGRRILLWTAHAPLILSSTDPVYRSRVLNTLVRGARHLDRHADKAPPGEARVAAWCGIVVAGLLLPGGDARRRFGETGLARALTGAVFDDGGAISRSPAGLFDLIELLAMVRASYAARRLDPPDFASDTLARMTSALLSVCHGDGGLASWQGGGPSTGERIAQVIAASKARARPLRQAREWGYQRLTAGTALLIVDAAPPPVGRLVKGGCASTLAFEFSDGDTRIIVNCGGADTIAAHAHAPASLAQGLRTTAAHSTLIVADSNSTAIEADGALGRGVAEVEVSRHESEESSRIEASHDGYVRRRGFLHRRRLTLSGDGRELRGEDSLLPKGRRRARVTPFAIRFHLGRGVEASPTADGQGAILRLSGGALWQFRAQEGVLAIEPSLWIDGDGRAIATQQLVAAGEAGRDGVDVGWVLRRAK